MKMKTLALKTRDVMLFPAAVMDDMSSVSDDSPTT